MDLKSQTIKSIRAGLDKKEFSAEELRGEYLSAIKQDNPKLNAYLSVFSDDEIRNLKLEIRNSPLFGVPCAVKDNILIEGTIATAGSKILQNYTATYDATVIQKLKKVGATFLGKANLDEFAMGTTTENSAFGPTLYPHDHSRVAGGSSGGSA
ncbi:MAG: amidase, partial [bacterium]|nr:amidase [bacterium]